VPLASILGVAAAGIALPVVGVLTVIPIDFELCSTRATADFGSEYRVDPNIYVIVSPDSLTESALIEMPLLK
jgi:hypothetical protein